MSSGLITFSIIIVSIYLRKKKNPVEQDPESRKHTKQKTSLRDEVETRTHNNSSDYSMV